MKEVNDFLKDCGTYYLATLEGNQPRVRPFGTVNIFNDKLYIQTAKEKNVFKQMQVNPKIEICAFKEGAWLRLEATAVADDNIDAKISMLDAYPNLKDRYSAKDDNTQVLFLKDAYATIESFSGSKEEFKF